MLCAVCCVRCRCERERKNERSERTQFCVERRSGPEVRARSKSQPHDWPPPFTSAASRRSRAQRDAARRSMRRAKVDGTAASYSIARGPIVDWNRRFAYRRTYATYLQLTTTGAVIAQNLPPHLYRTQRALLLARLTAARLTALMIASPAHRLTGSLLRSRRSRRSFADARPQT